MIFEKIFTNIYLIKGELGSNIYFLDFDKKVLIDSGHSKEDFELIKILQDNNINNISYLINTHSHGDHCGGNYLIKHYFKDVKIINSEKTIEYQNRRKEIELLKGAEDDFKEYPVDIYIDDNYNIDTGNCKIKLLYTPGHTIDSIIIFLEDQKIVFSGDLIYNKLITQIDYYQDLSLSLKQLYESYEKIKQMDIIYFFPGHTDKIENSKELIDNLLRKIKRLENNPEMILINTFIPSVEYFIHKNNGCSKDSILNFFTENMLKFKSKPYFKWTDEQRFPQLIDKMLSLMLLLKIINIENNNYYLSSKLNNYLNI